MRLRELLLLGTFPLLLAGCSYEDATGEAESGTVASEPATSEPAARSEISVPDAGELEYDPAMLEQQRRDAAWRAAADRDRVARASRRNAGPGTATGSSAATDLSAGVTPPGGTAPGAGVARQQALRAPVGPETFDQISPDTLGFPPRLPVPRQDGGPMVLRTQILLDRARFSPGALDGLWGKNTEKAVYWFQEAKGLEPTGEVDQETWDALQQTAGNAEPLRRLTLTEQDLRGPFIDLPDDVYARAKLDCLCYEGALEMMAERSHATPDLLRQLNPQANFDRLQAGDVLWVPNVPQILTDRSGDSAGPQPAAQKETGTQQESREKAQNASPVKEIVISKTGSYLHALDEQGNILHHFPSTLGSEYDPSPDGDFKITGIHPRPDFHYQPKLFHDVPDTEEDAYLPSGPNSPVGLVWMQISKPNYGIHGTAVPETIGYTASHGCIRLTNWDAVFLSELVPPGVRVRFVE